MREIKFRAWDKEKKEMIGWEVLQLNAVGFVNSLVGRGNWIPLQFTGLLDKNGKEIYEGDVVSVDWRGLQGDYIVNNKFNKPFVVEFRNYEYAPFSRYLSISQFVEVIGNIHENPNLLNKKK